MRAAEGPIVIAELLSIVAPVYLCIGVGFVWRRLGRPVDNNLLADLIMNVGAPCLIFSNLVGQDVDAGSVGMLVLAALLAHASFAVVGLFALKLLRIPTRTFLAPIIFPNTGNMGLPILLYAFGEEGLALGVVFFTISATTNFTIGLGLWSGHSSLRQLYRTPLVYGTLFAIAAVWLDLPVPSWLMRTTGSLGNITIPLMQFALGVSLAELKLKSLTRTPIVAVLRFAIGLGVGVGLAAALGLEGTVRGVFIIDCAMPVAVINYLFAARYNRSPQEVASVVVLSTTLTFVTLPLLLAWLL